jgi:hypothetical protein
MRDTRINVLYCPEILAAGHAQEGILLSDELHFIERPSF